MNEPLLSFLIAKLPELGEKFFQQIYLTGIAVLLAILIGVPMGILAQRIPRLRNLILNIANILQTIPSLALLAFLIPFLGIGIKPAIIALSVYALLPIVRNTVVGIDSVSIGMTEAAESLGLSNGQTLRLIELPLALPIIIAGIRIATAMAVGIATIAAFIGAGGLGDFIFQGISLNDNRLVLLGGIPAAFLALFLDYFIGQIEKFVTDKKNTSEQIKHRRIVTTVSVILILFVGFFTIKTLPNLWQNSDNTVRIATKNFTEQYILGYLMADLIETKTNLKVDKKFNLGATDVCHAAMLKGEIDMYPEYTGTAYAVVLKQENPGNKNQIYQQVKDAYQKQFNITWLSPFGFNDTQAIAVREDFAKKYHLNTISDIVPLANKLRIGVPAEFIQRQDAFPGLQKTYGINFGDIRQMDPGLMYKAIANNNVDVILAFSTDGRIAAYHLKILQDDKHFFPPYYAAPLIRSDILKNRPEITNALAPLTNLINDQAMQHLNYQVDVLKQSPENVAKNFLLKNNLI